MKIIRMFILVFPLILLVTSCTHPIKEFTPSSELIFKGTVILPNSSTINALDVSDLAIVRVDKILSGPKIYNSFKGRNITVKLKNPKAIRKDNSRIFFSKSWHFGESVAVIEVGNMETGTDADLKNNIVEIKSVQKQVTLEKLYNRIKISELIVSGRVTKVKKSDEKRFITEHDPDWYLATIEISEVLKGKHSAREINVLFPNSNDVVWKESPKFKPTMSGIWLLQPYQFKKVKLKNLTIVNKNDFRPITDKEKMVRLIRR